ncbi:hypothetical protein P0082_11025 [Candidatus Haliotispira prima]|uniref:Tetratricopeptide repeat protein n=1 Tax=Candidatus Haliotispira prima TaxID=3034016 RepID=A0ABY8MGD1_9SPIO|nr:hypothetical protein P0082_11025 [Candidatus Haliotispira prima]
MFVTSVFIGVIVLFLIIIGYIYKQINYREWLKTDDGLLQVALEKLKDNPKDIETLRLIANLLYKKRNYEKAFEYYSKFIVLTSPTMPEHITIEERFNIHLEFGLTAYHLKRLGDALMSLQKARRTIPEANNLQLSATLGKLLFKKQQFPNAVTELERFHRLAPNDSENNFYLGMCYANLDRFKEGLLLLQPLETERSGDQNFLLALASCLDKTGETESAIKHYKSLIENGLLGAVASGNLAHLYLRHNNTGETLRYLEKVPELETPTGELSYKALYDSARVYVKLGKLRDACTPLQKLCDMSPNYRDAETLLQNYREMASNYNLYLLYYGEKDQRKEVVHQLLQKLISNVHYVDSETYTSHTIEVVANSVNKQDARGYYIWISLANEPTRLDQVREPANRGRQRGCNRYVFVSTNTFDDKVRAFSEVRPIDLVEGLELREKLLEIS